MNIWEGRDKQPSNFLEGRDWQPLNISEGRDISVGISEGESFGEEWDKYMETALLLKHSCCSVGNFAAKFLMVIFRPEELVNKNCMETRRKERLDNTKMGVLKKCVFKLYPCSPAHKELVWRKCVVAIDEFLRRKKGNKGQRHE